MWDDDDAGHGIHDVVESCPLIAAGFEVEVALMVDAPEEVTGVEHLVGRRRGDRCGRGLLEVVGRVDPSFSQRSGQHIIGLDDVVRNKCRSAT